MITENHINDVKFGCKMEGHNDVSLVDIAYFVLKREFQNAEMAYQLLNPSCEDAKSEAAEYEKTPKMQCVRRRMNEIINAPAAPGKNTKVDAITAMKKDITFEENKGALVEMLARVKEAAEEGQIEIKDALKIETDIRIKLNDKFGTSDENDNHFIIVEKKYNAICSCGREIYIPTKEDMMEKYHLVPDPEYASEGE